MEPATIGSLVATLLVMAAEAVLKGPVGEAVQDRYNALWTRVAGGPAAGRSASTPAASMRSR